MDLIKQYSSDEDDITITSDENSSPTYESIINLPIYSMNASNLKNFNLFTFIPWKPHQLNQSKLNAICANAIKQCDIPDINWISTNVGNTFIRFHMTLQSNAIGKGYQIKQLRDSFKSYLQTNDFIKSSDIFTNKQDIAKQTKLAQFLNKPPGPPRKFLKFKFNPHLRILPSRSTERVFLAATFKDNSIFHHLAQVLYQTAKELQIDVLDPIPDQFHVSLQQGDFMSKKDIDIMNERLSKVEVGIEEVEFLVNEVTFIILNNVETVSLIPNQLQELDLENNVDSL